LNHAYKKRVAVDLRELKNKSPEGHWYYESKYSIIKSILPASFEPSKIIEIGAGSKFFIKRFLDQFPNAQGWAVDPGFTSDQLGEERNLRSTHRLPEISAELYLFIDVLEHVKDDLSLLVECTSHAKPETLVVVSVPAFQHLWSGHDDFLGHHRRYTKKSLRFIVESANLNVLEITYTFSLLYPLAIIKRKLAKGKVESRMKKQKNFLNSILLIIFSIFRFLNSNQYFGLTVIAIARKPD